MGVINQAHDWWQGKARVFDRWDDKNNRQKFGIQHKEVKT